MEEVRNNGAVETQEGAEPQENAPAEKSWEEETAERLSAVEQRADRQERENSKLRAENARLRGMLAGQVGRVPSKDEGEEGAETQGDELSPEELEAYTAQRIESTLREIGRRFPDITQREDAEPLLKEALQELVDDGIISASDSVGVIARETGERAREIIKRREGEEQSRKSFTEKARQRSLTGSASQGIGKPDKGDGDKDWGDKLRKEGAGAIPRA